MPTQSRGYGTQLGDIFRGLRRVRRAVVIDFRLIQKITTTTRRVQRKEIDRSGTKCLTCTCHENIGEFSGDETPYAS